MAFDAGSGTLYVLDTREDWIRAIDREGRRTNLARFGGGVAEGPGSPSLDDARWLAVDEESGTMYVADRCQVASIKGDVVAVVAGSSAEHCGGQKADESVPFDEGIPAVMGDTEGLIGGIAINQESGDLLLGLGTSGIFSVDVTGAVKRIASTKLSGGIPSTRTPTGRVTGGDIAVDQRSGDIFVTETTAGLVLQITPQGEVIAIAGNGEHPVNDGGGSAGKAVDTALADPSRLAVDSEGNVYVQDDRSRRAVVRVVGR